MFSIYVLGLMNRGHFSGPVTVHGGCGPFLFGGLLGIVARIAGHFGYVKQEQKRGYAAAVVNRLTGDWLSSAKSGDADLRYSLKTLRGRSRELAMNNDYMKKYLQMCVVNIVGPNGIGFQNKAMNMRKDASGRWQEELDVPANRRIEEAWADWGRKASICGRHTIKALQKIFIVSVARDGECFVRIYSGKTAGNDYNFALQIIEADYLDENYNLEKLSNGNSIRMGIEYDAMKRPVAYHLYKTHPGEFGAASLSVQRERVPAAEIIHGFDPERASQSRGVPWAHTAMTRLNMLAGYEEAELVAARVAAAKMGFFEATDDGAEYTGTTDDNGDMIAEAEPGTFEKLAKGLKFVPWDPQHPAGTFPFFRKAMLMGAASGLGVSYNSLASDLESVNYSSIRSGSIEERDGWRYLQGWMIDVFCRPVFDTWIDTVLLTGAVNLPYDKIDKFNAPKWQVRGWQWVDPMKDIKANIEAVNAGLMSRNQILSQQGLDVEEVFDELAAEQSMADSLGLTLTQPKAAAAMDGAVQNGGGA